jgi:hypothetical protein
MQDNKVYQENDNEGGGIKGSYVVKIQKKDGTLYFPFGETPLKNMILDDLFDKAINNVLYGYSTLETYVQSMRVGGGAGSDTPAVRTQTGLQGTLVATTHASTSMLREIDSGINSVYVQRDFKFDAATGSPWVVREATVGSFGQANLLDSTLSRFVLPSDITIGVGDVLFIVYRVELIMPYLNSDVPISLVGSVLNFSGNLRYSGAGRQLVPAPTSIYPTEFQTYSPYGDASASGRRRDYRNNTTSSASSSWHDANTTYYPRSLFIVNFNNSAAINDSVGFYGSSHTPVNYPNIRTFPTYLGPLCSLITKSGFTKDDNGCIVNQTFSFPAHTSSRNAYGCYVSSSSSSLSKDAIYLHFTNPQTIPASQPIQFTLQWRFSRL